MHYTIKNLNKITSELKQLTYRANLPNIIAVSKTFPIENILPLIQNNHIHFGENKIQEALTKWTSVKAEYPQLKLHMLGKLQTNKVKFLLPLFDYLHSLDSYKLAEKISKMQIALNKKPKIFIQVNFENEIQKVGINFNEVDSFLDKCVNDLNLDIVGLMCLPPKSKNPSKYFYKLKKLCNELNLKELSMGMSNDYPEAYESGSTFLRIGSSIFGKRD